MKGPVVFMTHSAAGRSSDLTRRAKIVRGGMCRPCKNCLPHFRHNRIIPYEEKGSIERGKILKKVCEHAL